MNTELTLFPFDLFFAFTPNPPPPTHQRNCSDNKTAPLHNFPVVPPAPHPVGASPLEVNAEEKDWLGSKSANSMMETSAQVQLGPGMKNPKELPNKTNLTGGSKECAKDSRSAKNDVANEGYTCRLFKQDPIRSYSQGLTPCG